jgi:hypothetical protein
MVNTRRPRPRLVLALIFAALIASASTVFNAPSAHAGVPFPHLRPPAKIHPHPPTEIHPHPAVRDILPEVRPSNDPNEYDRTGIGAPARGASQYANGDNSNDSDPSNDANQYDSTAVGASPAGASRGTSQYASDGDASRYTNDDDHNDGGLNLGSIGVAGGFLVSVASLVMWLSRKR